MPGKQYGDSVIAKCFTMGMVSKKIVAPAWIVPANTPVYASHNGYLRIFTSGGNDEGNDACWIDGGSYSSSYFNVYFNVANNQYVYTGQLIGKVIPRKDTSFLYFAIRKAPPVQPMMKRQMLPIISDRECHCYLDPLFPEYFIDPMDLRILWEYNDTEPETKLKVNIKPSWIGEWSFNKGITWHKSGEEISGLPIKYYKIIFKNHSNWQAPLPIDFKATQSQKDLNISVNYYPEKISDALLKEANSRLMDSSSLLLALDSVRKNAYDSSYQNLKSVIYNAFRDSLNSKISKIESEQESAKFNNKILYIVGPLALLLGLVLIIFYFQYHKLKKQKRYVEDLQKELHHRVRNNLGIISGLIDASAVKNETSIPVKDLEARVKSISFVHEQLYQQDNITALNLQNFLETLCSNLIKTYASNKNINYTIDAPLMIETKLATQLALVVAESITNSLKHGSISNQPIELNIKAALTEDKKIKMVVKDNGNGFPNNYDFKSPKSYGIQMMKGLIKQMKGEIQFKNQNGAIVEFSF